MDVPMEAGKESKVLETVWPWKGPVAAPAPAVAPKPAWVRGTVQGLAMGAAGFALRHFGHETASAVVWSLGLATWLSSVFWVPGFRKIERFGQLLGKWTGTGLSYLLLVPFFYLVFVPGRLATLLAGKDPMRRKFPSGEASCWSPRRGRMDERHYRKQFS